MYSYSENRERQLQGQRENRSYKKSTEGKLEDLYIREVKAKRGYVIIFREIASYTKGKMQTWALNLGTL